MIKSTNQEYSGGCNLHLMVVFMSILLIYVSKYQQAEVRDLKVKCDQWLDVVMKMFPYLTIVITGIICLFVLVNVFI